MTGRWGRGRAALRQRPAPPPTQSKYHHPLARWTLPRLRPRPTPPAMPLLFPFPAVCPCPPSVLFPPRCRLRVTLTRAAAASTAATPAPSTSTFAVEDYLVASCHLTPPQALKASKSLAHLKSGSNADAVLAFLAGLGLSPKEVAAVVASNPRILCARIDRSLAPISAELRALGLSPSQVARLAQIAGRYFLCRSFVSKVRFWLPLFGSRERLLQASDWNYWLLTSDLEKVVEPNVVFLKQCGLSSADISKLLVAAPRLVTMHPEYVQDAVRRATQLGVAPGSQMFRHALSTAGCIGQEKVDAKVAVLKETLGWSQEEVNLAISKAPRILVASEERLRRNAEFLLNEVGLPPQYIARRSVLLMYSLERRIVPRHLVLKALKERGLVEQDRCFFNVVAPTEEKFLEKFVAPFEESIPGLADAYESAFCLALNHHPAPLDLNPTPPAHLLPSSLLQQLLPPDACPRLLTAAAAAPTFRPPRHLLPPPPRAFVPQRSAPSPSAILAPAPPWPDRRPSPPGLAAPPSALPPPRPRPPPGRPAAASTPSKECGEHWPGNPQTRTRNPNPNLAGARRSWRRRNDEEEEVRLPSPHPATPPLLRRRPPAAAMLRLQKQLLPLHRSAYPIVHLSLQRALLSISAAAASSPGHISAEDYLVTTCGLTREDAAKTAKYLPHWKSPAKADAVLDFLTSPALGLSKAEIALLVTKDPRILSSSVDKTLRARLEGFRRHGFSTAQIRSFVRGAPFALRANIDEKLSFWMSFMGSPDKFLRIIKRNYYLVSSDLDKVVKTNIRLLQERGLSIQDIDNMCVANPRLLTSNPDTTRAILVRAGELGIPQNTNMFMQAVSTVAGLGPETIASKLKMMCKMLGCSSSEVSTMVQTNPQVLRCSKEKFQRVYEFLTKVVGVDAKYIMGRPTILMYSLERRLAPRNYVMKPAHSHRGLGHTPTRTAAKMLSLKQRLLSALRGAVLPPAASLHRLSLSTDAAAVARPAGFLVEDYLVASCGLTPAQARKASKYLTHVRSPDKPDAVRAFLADVGLSESDVAAAVVSYPMLLSGRVDGTLTPRIAQLRELGLSPPQISSLIAVAPEVLFSPVKISKLAFYLSYLGSYDRVHSALSRCCYLLRPDLDTVVRPNITFLHQCGLTDDAIGKHFLLRTRILLMEPQRLKEIAARAEEIGVPRNSVMFKHVLTILYNVNAGKVNAKFNILKKVIGCSEAELSIVRGPLWDPHHTGLVGPRRAHFWDPHHAGPVGSTAGTTYGTHTIGSHDCSGRSKPSTWPIRRPRQCGTRPPLRGRASAPPQRPLSIVQLVVPTHHAHTAIHPFLIHLIPPPATPQPPCDPAAARSRPSAPHPQTLPLSNQSQARPGQVSQARAALPEVHCRRTLRDAGMAALRLASFTLRPAAASAAASPSCAAPAPRSASFARAAALPSLRLAPPPRRRGDLARPRAAADAAAESYASALSEVATENGTLENTVADLEKLEKIFADEAVAEFFDNPTVPREEKTQLIEEIAKSSDLQPHVVNFLNVVVDNFRAAIVPQIVTEFENVYNGLTGTEVATVTSVVQLESQDLAQIAQHVQKMTGAKNVRLKTQLDPDLIAGFTVQYGRDGSNLIDMSVKKQIEEIASEFELPSVALEV
nr:unnamed protein product [Digitaria exilis]